MSISRYFWFSFHSEDKVFILYSELAFYSLSIIFYIWNNSTIFSRRIPTNSAFLYLAFNYKKVYLFDGIFRGIILIVFLIGSVSIFNILDNKFSFCFTISFSTTLLWNRYIYDIYSISLKEKKMVSMVMIFWSQVWSSSNFEHAFDMTEPILYKAYFHLLRYYFVRLG